MPPIRVECYTGKLPRAPNSADIGDQFGRDLPHPKARKDLTDEFKNKILCDNSVHSYRLNKAGGAAAEFIRARQQHAPVRRHKRIRLGRSAGVAANPHSR